MSAYYTNRRVSLRLGFASAAMPFMSNLAFGESLEDERTAWYRAARFGMFIHWGPYSQSTAKQASTQPSRCRKSTKRFSSMPVAWPVRFDGRALCACTARLGKAASCDKPEMRFTMALTHEELVQRV